MYDSNIYSFSASGVSLRHVSLCLSPIFWLINVRSILREVRLDLILIRNISSSICVWRNLSDLVMKSLILSRCSPWRVQPVEAVYLRPLVSFTWLILTCQVNSGFDRFSQTKCSVLSSSAFHELPENKVRLAYAWLHPILYHWSFLYFSILYYTKFITRLYYVVLIAFRFAHVFATFQLPQWSAWVRFGGDLVVG